MTEEIKIKGGLISEPRDNRDFSFGKVFGTIDLSEIPDDFIIGEPKAKRNPNDFCTAFATTSASELQEGVELNPYFQFALSKMISGDPEEWGQQLHPALKAQVQYGAIEEKDFNRGGMSDNDLRYIKNYPAELFTKAEVHKKQSYFSATGYKDTFDSFQACLYANRAIKRAIITGCKLHDNWLSVSDGIIKEEGNPTIRDAFIVIGKRTIDGEPYLIAELSADVGDNGKLYFPRNIVNKYFTSGGFCWVDLDPEEAKKVAWPLWLRWWEWLKSLTIK